MRFEVDIRPLDLDLTLGCGQTFRWQRQDDGSWLGVVSDQVIRARASRGSLQVTASPGGRGMRDLLKGYFRAEDDIEEIQRTLSSDPVLSRGMRHLEGLRIVKMDEWECLVSYMLATYANIPRITKMVEALCRRYGSDIGNGFMAFPSLERLRKASIADLRALRLGYRADYIRSACDSLSGEHLEQLKKMPYPDLRERLIELPGVGEKVADCVSLFGFGRLEAFPIDVWMERALARLYGQKGSYARLMSFAHARFGKYAGYAQEYLYHNERMHAHADACVFTKA